MITNQLSDWVASGKLNWEARVYERGNLFDAYLVVSVDDAETNARVFAESEATHTFCNSVDDVSHCSCYAPSIVRRGPLQIAISTAGSSPALAQRLRKELEEQFGEEYGAWVAHLGEKRRLLFQDKAISSDTRLKMLHELASAGAFETFRRTRSASGVQASVRDSAGSPKSG